MEGVAPRAQNQPDESGVKGGLTTKRGPVRPAGTEPVQLCLGFAVPDAQLAEPVGLAWGQMVVHAVPTEGATARRLGLDGWPMRAFCGTPVRPTSVRGGTDDPDDLSCQRCLRALRRAGLL